MVIYNVSSEQKHVGYDGLLQYDQREGRAKSMLPEKGKGCRKNEFHRWWMSTICDTKWRIWFTLILKINVTNIILFHPHDSNH